MRREKHEQSRRTDCEHDVRVRFPHYLAKVEKKGWTREELLRVIEWLTGYNEAALEILVAKKVTFEQFFRDATLNPNAQRITGVICGYRVEEIEKPLTRQVRYLDKLLDELAKERLTRARFTGFRSTTRFSRLTRQPAP
jgi:hypothetical protein